MFLAIQQHETPEESLLFYPGIPGEDSVKILITGPLPKTNSESALKNDWFPIGTSFSRGLLLVSRTVSHTSISNTNTCCVSTSSTLTFH